MNLGLWTILFFTTYMATDPVCGIEGQKKEPVGEEVKVPSQNLNQGEKPDQASMSEVATTLLKAFNARKEEGADTIFFQKDAFLRLKSMPGADKYYLQLTKWFRDDVAREINKFKEGDIIQFKSFVPGFCKWKPVGSEYNSVAYWSCRKSKLAYTRIDKEGSKFEQTLEILTIINWGANWFVTHLGPIPATPQPEKK